MSIKPNSVTEITQTRLIHDESLRDHDSVRLTVEWHTSLTDSGFKSTSDVSIHVPDGTIIALGSATARDLRDVLNDYLSVINPEILQKPSDYPEFCSNCDQPLKQGKTCRYCAPEVDHRDREEIPY